MPAVPLTSPLLSIFNAQPSATLLLSAEWVIVGASDDYLTATLTERDVIVGQYIFDAFPDNPEAPEAQGVANVRASLAQVMATKQPHEMPPQHYDVLDPARPGHFVERHWLLRHTPVLDDAGQVQFIIQSVQDITASRLAERQLRESQAREQAALVEAERQRTELQRAYQEAPIAMGLMSGPDFVVEWVNYRMGQLWGRPVEQIIGRPHFEALPDLAGQGFEQVLTDVLKTGQAVSLQEMLVHIEQTHRSYQGYFNITYQPLYNGQHHVTGILCSAFEVTEQVRARRQVEQLNQELEARVQERTQQVQAQNQRLERLFRQAPAAIAILAGPDLVFELVNPIYQRFFPDRQLLGKPLLEALPELTNHAAYHTMRQVFDTGESSWQQALHAPLARTDNGALEDRYFNYMQQPRYDEQGRIDGVLVFGFEVTELVQAQQQTDALQAQVLAAAQQQAEQRETFYQIFKETPAAICIQRGPEHHYEYINAAYQAFFTGREFIGRPVAEVLPETVESGVVALLDHVYQTGETYYGEELPLLIEQLEGQPPRQMHFTFTYQALREQGNIVGISTFAYDVNEQVVNRQQVLELNEELAVMNQELAAINEEMQATNEELNRSNEQLKRTNVDLDNFIYTASHDLKAPISNIEGLLHALIQQLPPTAQQTEPVGSILDMMQGAVDRFKQTIDHLTDISKLQQEHTQPTEQVNLAAIVEAVRLDLLPLLEETGAHLEVAVADCPVVAFSAKNLRSVVYNLLSNALKYRHPDRAPHVQVTCQQVSGTVLLRVSDNGLGLDETQQAKLFGMFRRLHTHVEGSGIGLYMVKKMVENVGGKIEVESEAGVGSVFTVSFPS